MLGLGAFLGLCHESGCRAGEEDEEGDH